MKTVSSSPINTRPVKEENQENRKDTHLPLKKPTVSNGTRNQSKSCNRKKKVQGFRAEILIPFSTLRPSSDNKGPGHILWLYVKIKS